MMPLGQREPLGFEDLQRLRAAAVALAEQSGRGADRRALIALASFDGVEEVTLYAGEPTVAVAVPAVRADARFDGLTAREREVAGLVATGLRNHEIAARLFVTEATVKDHVHSILRKSGLTTRTSIAARWNG